MGGEQLVDPGARNAHEPTTWKPQNRENPVRDVTVNGANAHLQLLSNLSPSEVRRVAIYTLRQHGDDAIRSVK